MKWSRSNSRSKTTGNNDTEAMAGYSLRPDSGITSSSSQQPPNLGNTRGANAIHAYKHVVSPSLEQQLQSENIDNEFHFGSSNPFGPLDVQGGKTTKTTSTSAADAAANEEHEAWTHTTVWTTVLANGEAYRTTRVVGLSRKRNQDAAAAATASSSENKHPHRQAIATPLTSQYEKSIPLGPTQRIILTYAQQPHYDGSYIQTTEFIRANNGSTTVKRQKFSADGVKVGDEEVVEYPPMLIASTRSPVGNNNEGKVQDEKEQQQEVATTISELTNTFAGNTFATSDVWDDRTRDPTVINYNAGFSEEMARKHSESPVVTAVASDSDGGAVASRSQQQLKVGANWSLMENFSNPEYTNGSSGDQEDQRGGSRDALLSCSSSSQSKSRRSRLLIAAAVCLVLALVIGAAMGAVASRRNGGSGNTDTAATSGGGDSGVGGGDGGASSEEGGEDGGQSGSSVSSSRPTPAPSISREPKPPTAPPASMEDVFTEGGFEKYWPSEDGWIVVPSFASFVSGQSASSYYDSYYIPDLPACLDKCNANDAVGGAHFDLSSQSRRSVCLCYKEAECYDPTLKVSGGTVFLREEHYIPKSQICQMSTCGYFPDDPICDGLNIIGVEALVDLELRKVVGLMEDEDIRVFEQSCADFLNDAFSRTESPVEGVRCRLESQDLSSRRRSMRRARSSTRYLQGVLSDDSVGIKIRVTGQFVSNSAHSDAESASFGDSVTRFFDQNGEDFVQDLQSNAEALGSDYYEDVVDIHMLGSAVPVPVPVRTPSPIATTTGEPSPLPTRNPTLKPSRMPLPWPTTESPSQRPTRRPTRKPTKAPTKRPSKAPSPKVSRMPVPWPTTASPSKRPTRRPTPRPSRKPTPKPSRRPPRESTTPRPSRKPTPKPSRKPTPRPTKRPTPRPSKRPTPRPTPRPSRRPTREIDQSAVKFCRGSSCWVQIGSTITGKKGDQLGDGTSFDLSGTRFSVSASLSSESGRDEAGFVKVYDVEGSEFVQVGQTLYGFIPGDEVRGILSGNGRRLAMYSHTRDNNTGRVWIYELQSKKWVEIGRIIGEEEGEKFSKSVALTTEGDIVAIGAPFANNDRGVVRVYRQKGNSWRQMGKELRGTVENAKFGWDVAIAANTLRLVVGQKGGEDYDGRGQALVFQYNGSASDGAFEKFGNAIRGDKKGDDFGRDVAISASGAIIAVGARFHDGPNGDDSGQVKAFSYKSSDNAWVQIPTDGSNIVGDREADEIMNVALSRKGNRLAAGGGRGNDDTGYLRVFDITDNGWKQVGGKLTGSKAGQKFGSNFSLSPDGTRLLVGSPARDYEKIRGSVHLFELFS